MFSGRGYCTQPTCFPVLGSPPILVFLCKTHCRHMLCYRHWLSHQTNKTTMLNEQYEMNYSFSTVTIDSDINEQENFPNFLKEYINQEMNDLDENKDMIKPQIYKKEIEWWNEITPWKNSENFNMKITTEESNDEETDYTEDINKNDDSIDSDYNTKRKRKTYKKKLERSITCRSYSGKCPLIFDGAFGLIQSYHQHQLCSLSNKKICLYQHFNSKHGFTREVSTRLVRAIIHHEDPYKIKLFSSTMDTPLTLFDPYHKVKCPLSKRDDIINTPCLTQEITRKSIRRHLLGVHRLDHETINKLIKDMIK